MRNGAALLLALAAASGCWGAHSDRASSTPPEASGAIGAGEPAVASTAASNWGVRGGGSGAIAQAGQEGGTGGEPAPSEPEPVCVDADGDGYGPNCFLGPDCDDADDTATDLCTPCAGPFGLNEITQTCLTERPLEGPYGFGLVQQIGAEASGTCEGLSAPPLTTDAGAQEPRQLLIPPLSGNCLCHKDFLDLYDLFWRADVPPGSSLAIDGCFGADEVPADDCDWQPLVHVQGQGPCGAHDDCDAGQTCQRDSAGEAVCLTVTTSECDETVGFSCGRTAGAQCLDGRCHHRGPPSDIGRFVRDYRQPYWHVRLTFTPGPDGRSPVLYALWTTLSCTFSV